MNRPYQYLLDGHTPVPADDLSISEFVLRKGRTDRRVGYTVINDRMWVSTVFLFYDHAFGEGPPVLFETMVFIKGDGDRQWRYITWEAAEAGHRRVVEWATTFARTGTWPEEDDE